MRPAGDTRPSCVVVGGLCADLVVAAAHFESWQLAGIELLTAESQADLFCQVCRSRRGAKACFVV
jgi:hypothetical protein